MKKKKIGMLTVMLFLLCLLAVACGQKKEQADGALYQMYYVNHDKSAVLSYEYVVKEEGTGAILEELLAQLAVVPAKLEYHAPLASGFILNGYSLSEGTLVLDFDEAYREQELITEILVRAAIVRTVTQVEGVEQVTFTVNGEPLSDPAGNMVGMMKADTFIDNAGNEINTYEKTKLLLYFANAEGTGLTQISRSVVYNSNFSLERQVVEEIIKGPVETDTDLDKENISSPVVNPATKIISVNVRDGICYVNLDEGFMSQFYNVSPEVTIYALTNSLAELGTVNKVQISVNGETNINYRETVSLSTMFERNLDMIEK